MTDGRPEQPISVKPKTTFRRRAVCCLAAILVLGTAFVWLRGYLRTGEDTRRQSPTAEHDRFLLPEIAPSPFRNASTTVGYVGSRECIGCHRHEHRSYLQTTHSRSLGDVA